MFSQLYSIIDILASNVEFFNNMQFKCTFFKFIGLKIFDY